MKGIFSSRKIFDLETLIVSLFILVCVVVFAFLPTKGSFQEVILGFFALLILPIFFIKLVLKDKICRFGFQIKSWRNGLWFMPLCFLVATLAGFVVFEYTDFTEKYFLGNFSLTENFWYFFAYEFLVVNFFVLLYELFFRGFVMFYFDKKFGANSVFIQFLNFHFISSCLKEIKLG